MKRISGNELELILEELLVFGPNDILADQETEVNLKQNGMLYMSFYEYYGDKVAINAMNSNITKMKKSGFFSIDGTYPAVVFVHFKVSEGIELIDLGEALEMLEVICCRDSYFAFQNETDFSFCTSTLKHSTQEYAGITILTNIRKEKKICLANTIAFNPRGE